MNSNYVWFTAKSNKHCRRKPSHGNPLLWNPDIVVIYSPESPGSEASPFLFQDILYLSTNREMGGREGRS